MKKSRLLLFVFIISIALLSSCATTEKPGITLGSIQSAETSEIHFEDTRTDDTGSTDKSPTNTDKNNTDSSDTVKTLTFISINDLHGYISQDENGKGGLSNTAYGIYLMSDFYGDDDDSTDVHDDLIIFANGDMFQGTALSNITKGQSVIEAMNQLGFDGMGIGNHEFDWGLDTILRYFDKDESNGEAVFPLINCNIRERETNSLISGLSEKDNLVSSLMTEKMGVKIGIISAIGPCENSILKDNVSDYRFADVLSCIKNEAISLDDAGAELISVNIHYGVSGYDPTSYTVNKSLSGIKNAAGEYLIDVVFNGHTHYAQSGEIRRDGGSPMPVIQAGANNTAFGYATFIYDSETASVLTTLSGLHYVSEYGSKYDKDVQDVIDRFSDADTLGSTKKGLAVSDVTIRNKSALSDYAASLMLAATGADYSIGNFGGLRSNGGITQGKAITGEDIYSIIPFDNTVILVEIQGDALYRYMTENSGYEYCGTASGGKSPYSLKNDDEYYTLAVIDYVYKSNYFRSSRSYSPYLRNERETELILRELFSEDVRLCGESGKKWTATEIFLKNKVSSD